MALGVTKQTNIVANKARHLIFFENSDLAYNYKTDQWTAIPAYTGLGVFGVNNKAFDIGLVRFSASAVDLQSQDSNDVAQTALLETGATDPNQGGRAVINGVRPLANNGTYTVRVGMQESVSGAVSYSSAVSPNSRSGYCNFRSEGRYVRVELTVTGGFTTLIGADIDLANQGKV